jgi:hypothetical protein
MFIRNESNKFMVYGCHVDLRKGVESLSGLIRLMHMSPTDGSVYVFLNRSRSRMKLLHWERGGYVIYYKRLEQGRISRKVFRSSSSPLFYSMRWDELLLFMEGVYPSAARRKRFNIQ